MAPSAITEVQPVVANLPLKAVEKVEDVVTEIKEPTPLEAISHGMVMPGTCFFVIPNGHVA
jgi:hypothetical protein